MRTSNSTLLIISAFSTLLLGCPGDDSSTGSMGTTDTTGDGDPVGDGDGDPVGDGDGDPGDGDGDPGDGDGDPGDGDGDPVVEQTDRLIASREEVRIYDEPYLAMAPDPMPNATFGMMQYYTHVGIVGQRLFASSFSSLDVYEGVDQLMDDAVPSVQVMLPGNSPGTFFLPSHLSDTAGRLWFVMENVLWRWDDAASIGNDQQPDAIFDPQATAFMGVYHEGSDRLFFSNATVTYIWNDASTRMGTDTMYDEEVLLEPDTFSLAGDRLVVADLSPNGPRLTIYDPATVSAASPDPMDTIDLAEIPRPIHAWGNLVFAAMPDNTIDIYDLDTLGMVAEIPYTIDSGPPWPDHMLYTANGTFYMFLGDKLEVWTDVPNNPTMTTSMSFDSLLTPARSLTVFECLVDAECGDAQCVSGRCNG